MSKEVNPDSKEYVMHNWRSYFIGSTFIGAMNLLNIAQNMMINILIFAIAIVMPLILKKNFRKFIGHNKYYYIEEKYDSDIVSNILVFYTMGINGVYGIISMAIILSKGKVKDTFGLLLGYQGLLLFSVLVLSVVIIGTCMGMMISSQAVANKARDAYNKPMKRFFSSRKSRNTSAD